jgi:hypothetical protein
MAPAPVAYCLWQRFLRFDPQDPIWPNRDRFILSAGHASMLLYALLHLTGVKAVSKYYETLGEPSVPLEALKHFRQLGSRCPGHPEYRWTSGVETTTGPLGIGGTGLDVLLGPVRRRHGTKYRHALLRGVGPAERSGQEVRLHVGTRRGGAQGAACARGGGKRLTRARIIIHSPSESEAREMAREQPATTGRGTPGS